MKKLLALVLCLVLCFAFSACNGTKGIAFESEAAMAEYVNGVWENQASDDILIFKDNKMLVKSRAEWNIKSELTRSFDDTVETQGYDFFRNLSSEKCFSQIAIRWENELESYQVIPKTGSIVYQAGSEFEKKYTITVEGIVQKEKAENTAYYYTKNADSIEEYLTRFEEMFKEEHHKYQPPINLFKLSCKQYAEAIKEHYHEINDYQLADNSGDAFTYTDTGFLKSGQYERIYSYTSDTFTFVRNIHGKKHTIAYGNDVMLVHDSTGTVTTRQAITEALLCLGDYPLAMSADELYEKHIQSTKMESGYKVYRETANSIKYEVLVGNGSTMVRIEVQ